VLYSEDSSISRTSEDEFVEELPGKTNAELLTERERIMREQDEALDRLYESVRRTQRLASEIADECDKHMRVLEDLNRGMRTTSAPKKKRIPVVYIGFKPDWTMSPGTMLLSMCKIKQLQRYDGPPEKFHVEQVVPERSEHWWTS